MEKTEKICVEVAFAAMQAGQIVASMLSPRQLSERNRSDRLSLKKSRSKNLRGTPEHVEKIRTRRVLRAV